MPLRSDRLISPGFSLALVAILAGCGPNNGITSPAPAAAPGSLATAPLPSALPTSTTVGPAGTGPAGSASSVGDGTAVVPGR